MEEAEEVYARGRRFAKYGITHVCHLLNTTLKLMTWDEFRGLYGRHSKAELPCNRDEFETLTSSLPPIWHEVINAARASQRQGETIHDTIRRTSLPQEA